MPNDKLIMSEEDSHEVNRAAHLLNYLDAMGIELWVRRSLVSNSGQVGVTETICEPVRQADNNSNVAAMDWDRLRRRVAACTLCDLHKTRTQTVFGVGNPAADLLFIGEAPGVDEDRQGEPFVGRAGQLLTNMIKAIGLSREAVFIANILKCRPPRNRDPKPQEAQACRGYLRRQIVLISPKVIVALGRIAAQSLLQTDTPISRMRGRQYRYENSDIPVVVTYHPAYLLRSPLEKRKAWQDLRLTMELLKAS